MTKAEIVNKIYSEVGLDRQTTQKVVDLFMDCVKGSVCEGESVYLRGFGTFLRKTRAAKTARNIKADQTILVPEHDIPAFKPSKEFVKNLK